MHNSGDFFSDSGSARGAYASDIMFETIRFPGLRNRSNRAPSTQFGVNESGRAPG